MISNPITLDCRDQRQRNRQQQAQHEAVDHQQRRHIKLRPDNPPNGLMQRQRFTELKPHRTRKKTQILSSQRTIQTELTIQLMHRRDRHPGTQLNTTWVPRHKMNQKEASDRDTQKHRDRLQQTQTNILQHLAALPPPSPATIDPDLISAATPAPSACRCPASSGSRGGSRSRGSRMQGSRSA